MKTRTPRGDHRQGLPIELNATARPPKPSLPPRAERARSTPRRAGEEVGERPVTRVGFAPIVRVDEAKREIELCATSEAVDAHGTVFAYAASRDAFARWAGNVREMHERKAVGRRVAVRFDDTARKVYVRVRISRGAEDTWQKVRDGTLQGASIGAANVVWRRERIVGASGGRPESDDIPVATRYDLVELSLVDLPSNPDALGITLVRDGVPLDGMLDELDERDEDQEDEQAGEENAGQAHQPAQSRIVQDPLPWLDVPPTSPDPAEAIAAVTLARGRAEVADGPLPPPLSAPERGARNGEPGAAKRDQLAALGAPGYVAGDAAGHVERARGPFSTNPHGPPDMGVPARAGERPTSAAGGSGARPPADVRDDDDDHYDDHNRTARLHDAARAILRACGCDDCRPALAALEDDADDADDADDGASETRAGDPTDGHKDGHLAARLTRALDSHLTAHTRRLNASIAAVHADVGELGALMRTVERRVAVIEEQPMPGGPQLRVADKTHALLPGGGGAPGQGSIGEQLRALESLAGRLSDPQAQLAVATEMIRLQQQAAGLAPNQQAMPRAGLGGY